MFNPQQANRIPSETNIDLMNDIEVYEDPRDGGKLILKCPDIESFQWTRRFSRPGEFMLATSFSKDKFNTYSPSTPKSHGRIIYNREHGEAAFITSRNVIVAINGDLRLIVRGVSIPSILDRRVFDFSGDATLQTFLTHVLHSNFFAQAGTARSMFPLFNLMPVPSFSNEMIPFEYRHQEVLSALVDILASHNLGMRGHCTFQSINRLESFALEFFQPTESIAVFSKDWGNVLEQNYFEDNSHAKNVVLVGDSYIYNHHITGIDRREISTTEPRQGGFAQAARDVLNQNSATRTLSSHIDVDSVQFQYGKDWDIGSIVLSQNKDIGFSEREIVTEIIEFFDKTGRNIEVNTGSYLNRR